MTERPIVVNLKREAVQTDSSPEWMRVAAELRILANEIEQQRVSASHVMVVVADAEGSVDAPFSFGEDVPMSMIIGRLQIASQLVVMDAVAP